MMLIKDHSPQFGHWTGEITSGDLRAYRRGNWSDSLLPLREKRWQYVGLCSEEFIIGLAIVHAGYVGNIFAYVFNRKTQSLWELERTAPLAQGIQFERGIHDSRIAYRAADEHIRFSNTLHINKRSIDVRLKNDGQILDIRAEIVDPISTHPPHQVLMPTPDGDCSFTHKSAGLTVLGKVRLGDQHFDLSTLDTYAIVDTTIGYHARETQWNWAAFAGKSQGRTVGLNLANPTQMENACWIDGTLERLAPIEFQYTDGMQPWRIRSQEKPSNAPSEQLGTVDLTFTPQHCRSQHLDYLLVSSKFIQPCGVFNGTLTTATGQRVAIENVPGVVEEHFAKW